MKILGAYPIYQEGDGSLRLVMNNPEATPLSAKKLPSGCREIIIPGKMAGTSEKIVSQLLALPSDNGVWLWLLVRGGYGVAWLQDGKIMSVKASSWWIWIRMLVLAWINRRTQ